MLSWFFDVLSSHPHFSSLAFLALLYILYLICGGHRQPLWIAMGEDGRLSSSKLQFAIWTAVVLYSYVALAFSRLGHAPNGGLDSLPANVLIAMGLSLTTSAAAKGITVSYLTNRQIAPKGMLRESKPELRYLVTMDDGRTPDLPKIQMLAWTAVAAVTFIIDLWRHFSGYSACTAPGPTSGTLACFPDIDTALMVLMGLGQGAYIGAKLVSTDPGTSGTRVAATPAVSADVSPADGPIHAGSTVAATSNAGLGADVPRGFF